MRRLVWQARAVTAPHCIQSPLGEILNSMRSSRLAQLARKLLDGGLAAGADHHPMASKKPASRSSR